LRVFMRTSMYSLYCRVIEYAKVCMRLAGTLSLSMSLLKKKEPDRQWHWCSKFVTEVATELFPELVILDRRKSLGDVSWERAKDTKLLITSVLVSSIQQFFRSGLNELPAGGLMWLCQDHVGSWDAQLVLKVPVGARLEVHSGREGAIRPNWVEVKREDGIHR
jgi:hypothetical protein